MGMSDTSGAQSIERNHNSCREVAKRCPIDGLGLYAEGPLPFGPRKACLTQAGDYVTCRAKFLTGETALGDRLMIALVWLKGSLEQVPARR